MLGGDMLILMILLSFSVLIKVIARKLSQFVVNSSMLTVNALQIHVSTK